MNFDPCTGSVACSVVDEARAREKEGALCTPKELACNPGEELALRV